MVDLGLVWGFFKVYLGIFRVRLFWRSFKVLRFVDILREVKSFFLHARSVGKMNVERTHQIAVPNGIPWISGKRQPPSEITIYIHMCRVYIYIIYIYLNILCISIYIYIMYI